MLFPVQEKEEMEVGTHMSKVIAFSIQNVAPFIHCHVVMTITIALTIRSMSSCCPLYVICMSQSGRPFECMC